MGYREVSRVEAIEVLRRHQHGESQRAIARALGLSRNTVKVYLRAAGEADGGEAQVRCVLAENAPGGLGPRASVWAERLAPFRDQVEAWLQGDHLQLTRVQELLGQRGLVVPYSSLRRYVAAQGWRQCRKDTVLMATSPPGEVAELDYGQMGRLEDPETGKRRAVWALVVVLPYSRHSFVWPLHGQTLAATVEGLEAAWRFFGGVPRRLVLDNFPAAVAGTDPLEPRPTRGFLEYSQARGFLVDPARVRRPQDKPHVERSIRYVRERFWKGGTFRDLADAREQAEHWCREVAGVRVHGTTRRLPLVVFEEEERAHLLALGEAPYDVPVWGEVTVHPDHHIAFQQALYSVPATTCPPGTRLQVRGDRTLVRLYLRDRMVKLHARRPRGGRSTDPEDYPAERTAYALRAPDRLVDQARSLGVNVGVFAGRLLEGPLPWVKLRQGQKLLRLGERYTPARLDQACAYALTHDLIDVRRLERILVQALDGQQQLPGFVAETARPPLPARFLRPAEAFDHRYHPQEESS
jgi:transposase